MARATKATAIDRMQRVADEIPELKKLNYDTPKFVKWRRNARVAVNNTFGNRSIHSGEFIGIKFSPTQVSFNNPDYHHNAAYIRGLDSAESILKSMIEEIEEYWNEEELPISSEAQFSACIGTRRVFVIHGHDDAARETVARFLETLDLESVILHEQANKGRTIIEKFEEYANVVFAVVLLTPDDIGGLVGERDDLKPRARQNVVFELGYFIGKLGRERVCPLVKGDLETPSDYDGVVYTKLDEAGGWKIKLLRELKAAGFEIDANLAVGP